MNTQKKISTTKQIGFNYENGSVMNIERIGKFTANYLSRNNPNLVFNDDRIEYMCIADKLHIGKPYHTLPEPYNIKYDGELVLHHTPLSLKGTALYDIYVCFLLKVTGVSNNDLDEVIEGTSDSIAMDLNQVLNLKDTAIVYYGDKNKQSAVIVLTTPIKIKKMPKRTTELKSMFPNLTPNTELYYVNATNIAADKELVEGFTGLGGRQTLIEGFDRAEVTGMLSEMECEMIPYDREGNSDPTNTYLVESTTYSNESEKYYFNMLKFFCIFIGFIVVVYVVSPISYYVLVPLILGLKKEKDTILKENTKNYRRWFDNIANGLLIALWMTLIIVGASASNNTVMITGFFFLAFWAFSNLVVSYRKRTGLLDEYGFDASTDFNSDYFDFFSGKIITKSLFGLGYGAYHTPGAIRRVAKNIV